MMGILTTFMCVLIIDAGMSCSAGGNIECEEQFDTDDFVQGLPFAKRNVDVVKPAKPPNILNWRIWETAKELYQFIFHKQLTLDYRDIRVHDARRRPSMEYNKQGFTLVRLKSNVSEWHSQQGQQTYRKELEELIHNLHPQTKRVKFTNFVFRGGKGEVGPAVNSPHLDNYQNRTEVLDFAGAFAGGKWMREEVSVMRDGNHPDGYAPRMIIGLWKPVHMQTPVCDHPLMLLDSSTFRPEHQVRAHQFFAPFVNGRRVHVKNLAAHLKFDPSQRWYYFHGQTAEEVVVFRHFTFDRFSANIHTSFTRRNCSERSQTRRSIETRATLYW